MLKRWLETWALFDFLLMPKQQNAVMGRMFDLARASAAAPDLIEEKDVFFGINNGMYSQLYMFVTEALLHSLMNSGSHWRQFPRIHNNAEFVDGLMSKMCSEITLESGLKWTSIAIWSVCRQLEDLADMMVPENEGGNALGTL